MNQESEQVLPWYRQFWFWFVFGPLIFIIVLCFFTVSLAFRYSDDVVTDNYYKSGLMINQTFKQDEKAAELGLKATLTFDRITGEVMASLQGNTQLPKQITLFLDNPVKSAKDTSLLMQEVTPGHYRGELTSPVEYSWYLALIPSADPTQRKQAEWLLTGDIDLSKTQEANLQPRVHQPSTK